VQQSENAQRKGKKEHALDAQGKKKKKAGIAAGAMGEKFMLAGNGDGERKRGGSTPGQRRRTTTNGDYVKRERALRVQKGQ